MSRTNKSLGAKIRLLRKEKGLSQEQFGALINTEQTNISALENGKLNPSVEYLEKVALALKININELFL